MDILTYPHPLLRQVMPDVDVEQGKETGRLLIKEVQNRKGDVVGLAANQIGIEERVCCFELLQGMYISVVNPYIVEYSEEKFTETEGCASLPGLHVDVERPKWIKIKFDAWVKSIGVSELPKVSESMLFSRFPARVLQHEIDHLDGVLITDYAPSS